MAVKFWYGISKSDTTARSFTRFARSGSSIEVLREAKDENRRKSSPKAIFLILVIGLSMYLLSASLGLGQAPSQEEFVYDSKGRRDPFVSLLDPSSPTGLRTIFIRPGEQVRLPVEIKVSGILWNGKEYFAIINEEVMKKGQQVEKVKIVEIEKDRVIVEYAEQKFSIPLRKETEK